MDQHEEFEDAQEPPPQHPQQLQQPVNLKIPQFRVSSPEAWFNMVEASLSCTTSLRITYAFTMCWVLFPSQLCVVWAT
jgi:hypothetical protein